ncbi:CSTF2 [Branchiostoma lanceolatum]|uniref:CSTF2 protein n=1 Tax=Branchiostoma lanceolatum TaxID=7740 RepID=A0A8K0A2I4_BRALA|nr:CSTF2 [Branchiostoma lanceolatum]
MTAKVDVDQSKQLQGLLNVYGVDLELERTNEYDIKDAASSQGFAEKARTIAEEKECPRYDDGHVDSRRRQRFAEVLNQLNQPTGDWEELDTDDDGDGGRLAQEWRYGRQPLDLNSQSLAAKKTMPSVYVGNLSLSVTKRELAGLFSSCGEVHDIWLANRRPDMEHTYAFVRFYDRDSCVQACETMRGVEMRGRALRVNIADEPIHDRSQKDSLVTQKPIGRYYPKTENSEQKKLVWALRQSCSRFHSQHVLYANEFFLQLKDPQPGAGFCANRLVVDFDEVLSWLDDIPEDLAPAVGDEGPAYTLQEGRGELLRQQKATRHHNLSTSASYRNQQHPLSTCVPPDSKQQQTNSHSETDNATHLTLPSSMDIVSTLTKSDSETDSLASDSLAVTLQASSNSNDSVAKMSDSTESNSEESKKPFMSFKQSSGAKITENVKVMSPASNTSSTSLSFKSLEKGNAYLKEPVGSQEGKVHLCTERVAGTGQLSPMALLSPPSARPIRRMSPSSRRHYRSPRCLYPVPGAPYPTMHSTTVPAAFPSSMFDKSDDNKTVGHLMNCPVGELVKLDQDSPNDLQLIELDHGHSDIKSSNQMQEIVSLFEENDALTQEHKDHISVQPFKSNLQLLEELLGGCEVGPSNVVVVVDEEIKEDNDVNGEENVTSHGNKVSCG